MGDCEAAGFDYVEVGSVGVACKYHVSGAVGDVIIGISGKVIDLFQPKTGCSLSFSGM